MKLEHIALWVEDLEMMKEFYTREFNASAGMKYTNENKQFNSYFLHFAEGGARIELMTKPGISANAGERGFNYGLAHIAITVGNRESVDSLTEKLRAAGIIVASEPRVTGDGYYESAILDPEGNYIELCAIHPA